jgi:hypothetical protein
VSHSPQVALARPVLDWSRRIAAKCWGGSSSSNSSSNSSSAESLEHQGKAAVKSLCGSKCNYSH